MAQFLKISVLIVAFFLFVQVAQSQITFTGRVDKDFNTTSIGYPRNQTLVVVPDYRTVTVSKWMTNHSLISGWDIKAFAFQYDWLNDTMYFGWDCWVICGDADGDGNPSASTDKGNVWTPASPLSGQDKHIHADSEAMLMSFWTGTPNDYVPQNNNWANYYPDVVVGNTYVYDGLLSFDAYDYSSQTSTQPCEAEEYPPNSAQCQNLRTTAATIPTATVERYRTSPTGGLRPGRSVQAVLLYRFPNVTVPDIEFSLRQFSRYGNFTFRPGIDSFKFAAAFFASSTVDNCGEEQTSPFMVSMPCTVRDACGVCGGNNSTCLDCAGVANGPKRYDHCGVCGGTNSTCLDCAGEANGPKRYDACGVCNGHNETCLDCSGVANGVKKYDACGVCDGLNETCLDCSGVPNGPDEYDSCGVCAGDDSSCSDCAGFPGGTRVYDECGVCDGDSSTCWDCAHVPNGPKRYDACGVCGGTNSTCVDCAGVANGPKRYDHCGVCGGTNSTCLDCAGEANGPKRYDHCGVCGGTNSTCLDCAGTANGPLRYDSCGVCGGHNETCKDCAGVANGPKRNDSCGVCGGNNSTCLDCAGVANGGKVYDSCGVCGGDSTTCVDCSGEVPINGYVKKYDECGVCDGDNSTCWDCAHIPNGPWVYDLCGVCGGHNEDCECYIYKNFTIIAEDTYVSLEHRSQNFDKSVDLAVSSNKERTLLKFDDIRFSILGATEQKPVILSAKIRLFIRGVVKLPQQGWEDSKLVLHNLDNNFCAEKATWECRDYDETGCCTEWKMLALYPKIKADYEWEETASTDVVNFQRGWVEFDVKEDIEDFLKNSFLNSKSYLLKKGCEKDFGWIRFWSSESGGQVNAPELAISIRARCGPEKVLPPADPCDEDK